MNTLVEKTASLIEKHQAESLARRREAAEQLRTLLLRNETPKKGDDERLAEMMGVLGIQPGALPDILETVQTLSRYEALVAEWDNIKVAEGNAQQAIWDVQKWADAEHARVDKEAEIKRNPLLQKLAITQGKVREATEAKQRISMLQAKWKALIDGINERDALESLGAPRGTPHGAPKRHNVPSLQ